VWTWRISFGGITGGLFTETDRASGEGRGDDGESDDGREQRSIENSYALAPDEAVVAFICGVDVIVGCGHGESPGIGLV